MQIMKPIVNQLTKNKWLAGMAAGALLLVSAGTANAHIQGRVYCVGTGIGIPGVKVSLACVDPASAVQTTDANGNYDFPIGLVAPCSVTVDLTTVPGGYTPVCPTTSTVNAFPPDPAIVDFCFNCGTPCPDCVDPLLGLGAASGMTVLELGAAKVSITGPAGGILGNIGIAPGGSLSMSGDEFVTGIVKLGPGAKFSNSSHGTVAVVNNADLSAEIAAAYAASANSAALPCTQTFTTLDGKSVTTIVGVSGMNVICVQNVVLGGKQILLTGPADAKFIFNVTGKFVFTGGGNGPQIRVDTIAGLQPSAVLYNIIGNGADVAFSGGGGGVNCCAAIVDGTVLAPYRKINLSPGLVNGQVISGKDINIVSGSSVRCPCP